MGSRLEDFRKKPTRKGVPITPPYLHINIGNVVENYEFKK